MNLYRAANKRIICDKHRGLPVFKGLPPEPIDEVYAKTYTYGCEYCHEEKSPPDKRCRWYFSEMGLVPDVAIHYNEFSVAAALGIPEKYMGFATSHYRPPPSEGITETPVPVWANLDGSLHIAGDTTTCSCERDKSGAFTTCRRCGGKQHWQPVYGGIRESCPQCDPEDWSANPLPKHDGGTIV